MSGYCDSYTLGVDVGLGHDWYARKDTTQLPGHFLSPTYPTTNTCSRSTVCRLFIFLARHVAWYRVHDRNITFFTTRLPTTRAPVGATNPGTRFFHSIPHAVLRPCGIHGTYPIPRSRNVAPLFIPQSRTFYFRTDLVCCSDTWRRNALFRRRAGFAFFLMHTTWP